jgi:hypothetical protein
MHVDLQNLADIEAIKNLKARYGQLVDGAAGKGSAEARAALAELFTEDVVADFGAEGVLSGRAALSEFLGEIVHGKWPWMWHSFHSPLITIDGDSARGSWTMYAVGRRKDAQMTEVVLGRFEDEYVRQGKVWRQKRLKFVNESAQLHK